jgi:hypothetical protein
LALTLLPWSVRAQENAPFLLRIAVSPPGPVTVNQRVMVTVTAMTPVRFVDPPHWPDLSVTRGRAVILPESTTLPGTERIGNQSYAALQRSYSIFPAMAGTLELAPVIMKARVSGPDGRPDEVDASIPVTPILARIPPGVTDIARLVVAPSFRLDATVRGMNDELRIGQPVTRHLHMEAEGTTAMLLPPPVWGEPEGVRVYADPPILQDRSERGEMRAIREDSAAFVPQRQGDVLLPGFTIDWLEPRSGRLQTMAVDPVRLTILPASGAAADYARGTPWWAWLMPAPILLGMAFWWFRRRHAPRAKDPLMDLANACRANNAAAAATALYRWTDDRLPRGGERLVARLAEMTHTPDLANEAAALGARVYGGAAIGEWRGSPLLAAARKADKALRRRGGSSPGGTTPLPPLNPTETPSAPRLTQPRWAR